MQTKNSRYFASRCLRYRPKTARSFSATKVFKEKSCHLDQESARNYSAAIICSDSRGENFNSLNTKSSQQEKKYTLSFSKEKSCHLDQESAQIPVQKPQTQYGFARRELQNKKAGLYKNLKSPQFKNPASNTDSREENFNSLNTKSSQQEKKSALSIKEIKTSPQRN